ncbi:MAG: signal peptidase II [Lachnospiraceae bacterium]|nr:signal peptidase II [Lachnospiraceae bacterium]
MKNLKYLILTLTIFLTDIHFKNLAEKTLAKHEKKPAGKFITLSKHHNRGLPMNIAENHQEKIAFASFIATGILELFYYYVLIKKDKPLLKTGLSLMLGGAYSNTFDRLTRKYVVDYFSFNYPEKLRKIVFNIGDIAIFFGTFLAIINALRSNSD